MVHVHVHAQIRAIYWNIAVSPKRLVLEQKGHQFCPPLINPTLLLLNKMRWRNEVKSNFKKQFTNRNMQMSFSTWYYSCLTIICKYIYYILYTATLKNHYSSRMVIIYIYWNTAVSPKRLVLEQKGHYFCPPLINPSVLIIYRIMRINKGKSKFFWKLTDHNMQMSFLVYDNFLA